LPVFIHGRCLRAKIQINRAEIFLYTNLDKACKTIKGGGGTDDASNCKGIGGYRIHVSASAAAVAITAETPDKKDLITLAYRI